MRYHRVERFASAELLGNSKAPVTETQGIETEREAHQSSDGQPDCEICSKILICINHLGNRGKELTLGIAEDLLRCQCSHMGLFKDFLQDVLADHPDCAKYHLTVVRNAEEPDFMCFWLQPSPGVDGRCYYSDSFGLLHKPTVPDHPGVMRAIDVRWIDMDMLKQWITTCNTTHGLLCKQIPWLQRREVVRPKYLIDTMEMCIVEGDRVEVGYIALSYQWGQTNTVRNTTELRERLLKPNALSDGKLAGNIPRTISDAFVVVKALSYRYLWVDALCVIQDDHVHLAHELSRMHRIYHSADFTIVAADGVDANHGLRGLKGLTTARNHSQMPIQLSGSEQVVVRHPAKKYPGSHGRNTYHTRAWTFQEFGFSLRRLVFANDAVEWHCEWGLTREDMIRELPEPSNGQYFDARQRPTVHRLLTDKIPTPHSLNDLVSAYSNRILSFPEDALSAFAGTQSLLEQFFQPGFLCGLPEFWFELALHWRPYNGSIGWRVASSSGCSPKTSYKLPSWSWIGWTGRRDRPGTIGDIQFPKDDDDYDGPLFGRFTEPVTKWYALSHPASLDRRPITSAWHEYRSKAIEGRFVNLPQGWKQHADEKRGVTFSHYRSHRKYSYPFPVPEPSSKIISTPVPQTAYLSAQTSRAFLCGKAARNNALMRENHVWLKSSQDQYAGFLYLNNPEQESLFKQTGNDSSSPNPLELVATSKGTIRSLFPPELDWELELERSSEAFRMGKKREERKIVDCMFVLWIEWEHGVAYRRACGVVHADVWEREREKELVDLILG